MVQRELSLADQFSKLKVNVDKFSLALFCLHNKDYRWWAPLNPTPPKKKKKNFPSGLAKLLAWLDKHG